MLILYIFTWCYLIGLLYGPVRYYFEWCIVILGKYMEFLLVLIENYNPFIDINNPEFDLMLENEPWRI